MNKSQEIQCAVYLQWRVDEDGSELSHSDGANEVCDSSSCHSNSYKHNFTQKKTFPSKLTGGVRTCTSEMSVEDVPCTRLVHKLSCMEDGCKGKECVSLTQ